MLVLLLLPLLPLLLLPPLLLILLPLFLLLVLQLQQLELHIFSPSPLHLTTAKQHHQPPSQLLGYPFNCLGAATNGWTDE